MATLVISYSRADQPLIRAVVSLLKVALREVERAVFWDSDIEPGDEWWAEIQRHIEGAPQLFVFWCAHSSRSKEVRREFVFALERGKRVVPVLLDDTPLSTELAAINGIDLRQAVRHVSDAGSLESLTGRSPAASVRDQDATVAAFAPFVKSRTPRSGA